MVSCFQYSSVWVEKVLYHIKTQSNDITIQLEIKYLIAKVQ